MPNNSLTRACILICIDEPLHNRVIVAALQIVPACFGVVVVPTIAQGVNILDINSRRGRICCGEDFAPGVVGVLGADGAVGVDELYDIALQVQNVVVGQPAFAAVGGIAERIGSAVGVVDELQDGCAVFLADDLAVLGNVVVLNTIDGLAGTDAVHVVGVSISVTTLLQAGQLSAVLPRQVGIGCAVVPVDGIATDGGAGDSICCGIVGLSFVGNLFAGILRQQICPVGILIFVIRNLERIIYGDILNISGGVVAVTIMAVKRAVCVIQIFICQLVLCVVGILG